MTINLGKVSRLLLTLLLLLPITGSAGGGVPSAFGQDTFSGNITTNDIIDLADNIAERVQEEVDNDVNLPIFSDDEENSSGINDSIDNSSSNHSDSNSNRAGVTIPSLPSPIITATTSTPPTIMINEIELNPTGEDDEGEEWIELYNPSDADINLSNYEISTLSGAATIKLPPDTIVGAGKTYVIELKEDEDYLSNIVESLILTTDTATTEGDDNSIVVVDRTPSLVDMSNDERTWQRIPDGDNEWRFVEETEGELNDPDSHSSSNNNSNSNNSYIASQIYDTIEHYYYSESGAQCIGYAGCIEGITTRIVDGDTLYVTANNNNSNRGNTIYKVDLALIEAPSRMEEEGIDSTAFTRDLCLGSNTLIDQDDKLLTTSLVDSSSIIAVVYCSSTNLNKELLDNGYAELDMQQCATSEFANESWAKDHGC